jgi:hypothetical protein
MLTMQLLKLDGSGRLNLIGGPQVSNHVQAGCLHQRARTSGITYRSDQLGDTYYRVREHFSDENSRNLLRTSGIFPERRYCVTS